VEEAQGSDILGRTLHPHQTNPRFPPSALRIDVAAHSLLCLLGSTQTRENIDVPHWGSYNPCKGRVLEWRLRMYGVYHHLAWTFTCPTSLCKKLRKPALTLENSVRWVSNKDQVKSENAVRQNGTGKYTTKALAFRPRSRTSP